MVMVFVEALPQFDLFSNWLLFLLDDGRIWASGYNINIYDMRLQKYIKGRNMLCRSCIKY